jgi:hypothetical protein
MKNKPIIITVVATSFVILLAISSIYFLHNQKVKSINSFAECAAAGYPIAESYPEQCFTPDGRGFTKEYPDNGVACTMEAKECPDGSFVGRQAPSCEFAPCP